MENMDVGAGNPDRSGSGRDGRNTYRSMVMNLKEIEKAYYLLSMHHSETMLENASLRRQIKDLSGNWRKQFVYWVKIKLGVVKWYE